MRSAQTVGKVSAAVSFLSRQPYRLSILWLVKLGFYVSHFLRQVTLPMLLQTSVPSGAWRLLEELYLDAANKQAADQYASLSETEKRATLKDFTKRQAVTSKRWSHILQNILSADLGDWRQRP